MSDYTKILFCLTALISGVLSEEIVEQQQQIEKLPETTVSIMSIGFCFLEKHRTKLKKI